MEEVKLQKEIKQLAKQVWCDLTQLWQPHSVMMFWCPQNQIASVKTLAKALVRSKKTKEQMRIGKAQLSSVSMQLQENLGTPSFTLLPRVSYRRGVTAATIRIAGCIQKSTAVMAAMNS